MTLADKSGEPYNRHPPLIGGEEKFAMDWRHLVLGSLTLAVLGGSADAGIFSRSKSKDPSKQEQTPPAPTDRVGELARVLRSSPDERRRGAIVPWRECGLSAADFCLRLSHRSCG